MKKSEKGIGEFMMTFIFSFAFVVAVGGLIVTVIAGALVLSTFFALLAASILATTIMASLDEWKIGRD